MTIKRSFSDSDISKTSIVKPNEQHDDDDILSNSSESTCNEYDDDDTSNADAVMQFDDNGYKLSLFCFNDMNNVFDEDNIRPDFVVINSKKPLFGYVYEGEDGSTIFVVNDKNEEIEHRSLAYFFESVNHHNLTTANLA